MPTLASETEYLSVEAVNADTIEEAVRTERKGFADSEAEPDAEELRLYPKTARLSKMWAQAS
jgi:hypothetical protein